MPVAVMSAQPKREVEQQEVDPMDKILKALNIASTAYGIYAAGDKAKELAKENLQKQKTYKADLVTKGLVETPEGDIKENQDSLYWKTKMIDANKKLEGDPLSKAIKELTIETKRNELVNAREKKEFEKTPEGKLSKLNSGDKQRLDNVTMAFNAVQDMAGALSSGENTFSIIGDNPFTMARTNFEESLGRMQSGGAISKDEESRFRGMAPKFSDSPEIRQDKINKLQVEMIKRLKTMGFAPEDLGYKTQDVSKSIPKDSGLLNKISNTFSPSANANDVRPPVIQNGVQYNWNPKTQRYE